MIRDKLRYVVILIAALGILAGEFLSIVEPSLAEKATDKDLQSPIPDGNATDAIRKNIRKKNKTRPSSDVNKDDVTGDGNATDAIRKGIIRRRAKER